VSERVKEQASWGVREREETEMGEYRLFSLYARVGAREDEVDRSCQGKGKGKGK
jgi:hypothetical protein